MSIARSAPSTRTIYSIAYAGNASSLPPLKPYSKLIKWKLKLESIPIWRLAICPRITIGWLISPSANPKLSMAEHNHGGGSF